MDIICISGLLILGLGLPAMFLGYKAKFDKKSITLEKNDKEHEKKHQHNENRIKELEKKNGHEQRQLDELKKSNTELKDLVIKLQGRIINCEKNKKNKSK